MLGEVSGYTQWDPGREHVRDVPPWATTLQDLDLPADTVFDQYTMDAQAAQGLKGLVGFITGVRSDESLVRYRSCVNKLNENYIVSSQAKNVKLCKPIYDWAENDIFKFFMENEIEYSGWYDIQHASGAGRNSMRVSTPIHSEAAKKISQLRRQDPVFYDRLLKVFPEMELQDRYGKDHATALRAQRKRKVVTWEDCHALVEEKFTGKNLGMARQRVKEYLTKAKTNPGDFTPVTLFKRLQAGTIKRVIMPDYKRNR